MIELEFFESENSFDALFDDYIGTVEVTELLPATSDTLGGVKIGSGLLITADGTLSVDVATEAQEDNTRPITSAAVKAELGNIGALLETI